MRGQTDIQSSDLELCAERRETVLNWVRDPRLSTAERNSILKQVERFSNPQSGDRAFKRAEELYAKAILAPSTLAAAEDARKVDRVVEGLSRIEAVVSQTSPDEFAAALLSSTENLMDWEATISGFMRVLEFHDQVSRHLSLHAPASVRA